MALAVACFASAAPINAQSGDKTATVTLVIEDPFGNSAILGEGAEHEAIPAEEAERLKVGMLVYDPDGNPVDG